MSYTFKQRRNRTYVYSKIIYFLEYDQETKMLKIGFNDGQVGFFNNVPNDLFHAFETCESKGNFFYKRLRNAGFKEHFEVA